jgi:predicted small secreted protein
MKGVLCMRNRLFLVLALVCFAFCTVIASAQEMSKDISKDDAIAIATEAVKGKGIDIEGASIVYDEGGQLWSETSGVATIEDTSPNYGILKNGFLKNYRIVLFDFKEPLPDVWVFIDKDTGEVLEVSR